MRSSPGAAWAVAVAALAIAAPRGPVHAATPASTADDVCLPSENPCLVTSAFAILPNAVLDFGTRAVHMQDAGQFDFESNEATILCGDFIVDYWGGGPRIQIKESIGGGMVGGSATIVARGSCSADGSVPCLFDADCDAAQAGTCTGTTGTVTLGDNVRGDANPAGKLKLIAYGNVSTSDVINLSKGGQNESEVDGGTLRIVSHAGSVTIAERLNLNGGSDAQGGTVRIAAAGDVTLDEWIDATGGDGGGGIVHMRAEGDVFLNDDINARSDVGYGLGGEISVTANGNITVTGNSSTNQTLLNTMGHASGEDTGSGGTVELEAEGDVTIGPYVTLRADAPAPDGDGGTIAVTGCNVSVDATSKLEADGFSGGFIYLTGGGAMTIDPSSTVQATSDADGEEGEITLSVRTFGTCTNDPEIHCLVNSDCTVGCETGVCENVNPDTGGTTVQFDPEPEFTEDPALSACN